MKVNYVLTLLLICLILMATPLKCQESVEESVEEDINLIPIINTDSGDNLDSAPEAKPEHRCLHDELDIPFVEDISEEDQEELNNRKLRRQLDVRNPEPIRITFDTSGLSASSMPYGYSAMGPKIEKQLQVAAQFFADRLKVDRLNYNKFSSQVYSQKNGECLGYDVPYSDVSSGQDDSDLHIYVQAVNEDDESYVANAGACYFYSGVRPTFGRIRFNLARYDTSVSNAVFEDQLETVLHEITHILGMSRTLYQHFINPKTGNSYYYDNVDPWVKSTIRGDTTYQLNTPNVLAYARSFYDCSSLQGVQTENYGSSSYPGSHWEKTVLFDEYMNPQSMGTKAYYTSFTFALLEDSGWYEPVYDKLDKSLWGRGQGCGFLTSNSKSKYFEFVNSGDKGCNHEYSGYGYGTSNSYTKNGGGSGDVVYYRQTYSNRYCNLDEQSSGTKYTSLPYAYYYGDGGRCAYSNVIQSGYSFSTTYQCHKFTCDYNNNISVVFMGEEFPCSKGGSCNVYVKGKNTQFKGTVKTPEDPERFCSVLDLCPNHCSQKGYCLSGQCHCISGYTGKDCSTVDYSSGPDPSPVTCDSKCKTCSSTDSDRCYSCYSGYYLGSGTCKTCSSWISNCKDCYDYNTCKTCNSGYYKNSSGTCSTCSSSCKTCSSYSTCTSCDSGYELSNGKCEKPTSSGSGGSNNGCPSGEYKDGRDGRCYDCPNHCTSCDYNLCTGCERGYVLLNYVCWSCEIYGGKGCTSCSDLYTCSSCASGYSLKSGKCK